MNLSGWTRSLIVLSVIWLVAVSISAYKEYPTGGRFGGIPVGPFIFWAVVENTDSSAAPAQPSDHYYMEPKLDAFVGYGAAPVLGLWAGYFLLCWVKTGFSKDPTPQGATNKHGIVEALPARRKIPVFWHILGITLLSLLQSPPAYQTYGFIQTWIGTVILVLGMAGLVSGLAWSLFKKLEPRKWAVVFINVAWALIILLLIGQWIR